MKVLFISRWYADLSDGGKIVAKRNADLLKGICEHVEEIHKPKSSKLTILKNILFNQGTGLTNDIIKIFNSLISSDKYDFVWLDGSTNSSIIKECNKRGIPTFCFFHNYEASFYKAKAETTGKILDQIYAPYIKRIEQYSAQNASFRVLLNERDASEIEKAYGKPGDLILPTSFDSIDKSILYSDCKSEPYLLFVGSNFWANQEGLEYFFKKIAPKIKIKLKIIGGICKAFNDCSLPENIELLGYVDDLTSFYVNASAIISPILSGSGTKTKTIEALRYGKTIIGSQEALAGISEKYYDKIGFLCHTDKDYIMAINSLDFERFNEYSYNLFNKEFSTKTVRDKLKDFIYSRIK